MRATSILRQAAAARTPLIRFVGKRAHPETTDTAPRAHPASPLSELPDSFMKYRSRAQQHGPLNSPPNRAAAGAAAFLYAGVIGSNTGASLGSVQPKHGEFFDRSQLPARFQRVPWSQAEIDAVETGGASMFV
ncbi:hypothetical protein LOZ61_005481 [Ophidiomyces ophidiicola]|uniref:Uncharacterized protein n=1 Tax=Ophidiomyces ophidiicola TaxID=1387563 RepID=A0ACB8US08_9EURO|nr:hypothetical protein LOZ61_005481 [Ophidiomyces ophidiicola]KAI1910147.1 hypothetical protein LOZ64_005019 [Ophidiomyces ophidiicola]KAI1924238.1 hypothetical protein LOZ60_004786 [Ophidiomyces ophidiicola]KAI2002418.1 hypothetical protein LOZ50_005025 [Ophidiomyces ophidiicola]KAI2013939.1 hypothetical protein LOZ46_005644 [Ophidiomyces ophidiicola]